VVVTVPGADARRHEVLLRGSMDVVDVSVAQGRAQVQVHDLKTGRQIPSGADVREHLQLGVYQTAVAAGAVDGPVRERLDLDVDVPVVPAGADLVQLRRDATGHQPGPKVQQQPAPGPDDPEAPGGPTWIEVRIGQAAEALTRERFVPTPGDACRYCEFHLVCPAQEQGAGVMR
jgi:hypothetical protein